jgi:hypothetical protein
MMEVCHSMYALRGSHTTCMSSRRAARRKAPPTDRSACLATSSRRTSRVTTGQSMAFRKGVRVGSLDTYIGRNVRMGPGAGCRTRPAPTIVA